MDILMDFWDELDFTSVYFFWVISVEEILDRRFLSPHDHRHHTDSINQAARNSWKSVILWLTAQKS